MTTRLQIYNNSLLVLGERKLASLTENRENRRILDQIWDDGFVDNVLEEGQWNFAMRTIQLDYTPSVEPDFGFSRAFEKPSDFVRISAICSDEFFNDPLIAFSDEMGYWFADIDTIYVKYISNDASYGGDLSQWPETFSQYAQGYMASLINMRITQSESKQEKLDKDLKKLLINARSKDALKEGPSFMPAGTWSRSRRKGMSQTTRFDTNGTLVT